MKGIKWSSVSILVGLFFFVSVRAQAQDIRLETSAALQNIESASVYPAFGIGYQVLRHHSIWLTFVPIIGLNREQYVTEAPDITQNLQAYSFGLQYRYLPLVDKTVAPYLKISALLIAMIGKRVSKSFTKTDRSINLGINVGVGLQVQIINKLGVFAAINYRRVNSGSIRYFKFFDLDGFWGQVGVTAHF